MSHHLGGSQATSKVITHRILVVAVLLLKLERHEFLVNTGSAHILRLELPIEGEIAVLVLL